MILRRKISQPVKFSSSSKFNKSFRGSPIGREEKHILRERLSKVKRRVFVCGRRCVTPYSNFWTDRFSSSFLPRVLHTVQHRSRPESADDVTFGLKQIRGVAKGRTQNCSTLGSGNFWIFGMHDPCFQSFSRIHLKMEFWRVVLVRAFFASDSAGWKRDNKFSRLSKRYESWELFAVNERCFKRESFYCWIIIPTGDKKNRRGHRFFFFFFENESRIIKLDSCEFHYLINVVNFEYFSISKLQNSFLFFVHF